MKKITFILIVFYVLPLQSRLQVIIRDSIDADSLVIEEKINKGDTLNNRTGTFFYDNVQLKDSIYASDSIISKSAVTGSELPDSIHKNETVAGKSVRINTQYFKSYYLDTRDIFLSPGQWSRKQWLTFSGLSVSFSVLLRYDDEIQQFAQEHRTNQLDRISAKTLEPWGSGYYSMGTMGLFYLYGSLFHKERMQKVALLGVKTYLVTGFMVLFPKNLLGRHRPYQDNPPDPYSWNGFLGGRAFVSGHTTSIWSVATIVASEYQDKFLVPVVSYSIATLSSLSRIYDNKHWFTDVLGGAFFGYAMGKLIYNRNNWKIKIEPQVYPDFSGIYLYYLLD